MFRKKLVIISVVSFSSPLIYFIFTLFQNLICRLKQRGDERIKKESKRAEVSLEATWTTKEREENKRHSDPNIWQAADPPTETTEGGVNYLIRC